MSSTILRAYLVAIVTAACLAGCATSRAPEPEHLVEAAFLDQLVDGKSRREDIQLKLGEASGEYESGRLLAYRLKKDGGGYALVKRPNRWEGVQYNLLLLFDQEGVLTEHSLVEIRSP